MSGDGVIGVWRRYDCVVNYERLSVPTHNFSRRTWSYHSPEVPYPAAAREEQAKEIIYGPMSGGVWLQIDQCLAGVWRLVRRHYFVNYE